jgi:hypothetical protein
MVVEIEAKGEAGVFLKGAERRGIRGLSPGPVVPVFIIYGIIDFRFEPIVPTVAYAAVKNFRIYFPYEGFQPRYTGRGFVIQASVFGGHGQVSMDIFERIDYFDSIGSVGGNRGAFGGDNESIRGGRDGDRDIPGQD